MSFAIEVHRGWRNLRVSQTHNDEFRRDVDDAFAHNFRLLTRRQQRILRHRAEGLSVKEVAHALGLGKQTIADEMAVIHCTLNINQDGGPSVYRACYLLGRMDAHVR